MSLALLLLGSVLVLLALVDRPVRRLPMTPALLYLGVGWAAGIALDAPGVGMLVEYAVPLRFLIEFALLVSLVAIGLRLRVPPTPGAWRVALILAGPTMVATIALGTLAARWTLALTWPLALLLSALLASTDPVLASEVQIRSDEDRDKVRLSLTAEGALNDGTSLPGVMLALGVLGLHGLGDLGGRWLAFDVLWPIAGGAAVGAALGLTVGRALRARFDRGDDVPRDELVYVGVVALAFGSAIALHASTFIVAFAAGATLLLPLAGDSIVERVDSLKDRLCAFGARIERLVEAGTVLAVGALLAGVDPGLLDVALGVVLMCAVRPLAVLLTVPRRGLRPSERRLLAWFGIRGIGTLYYLLFALEHGVRGGAAERIVAPTLVCVALSIVAHGVSATPLMAAYHRRRGLPPPE